MIVGQFAEVCRRRRMKVNAGKSKVMVLNAEEGLVCEFHVDGNPYFGRIRQMGQNTVGRWRVGGGLQVPPGPWLMVGICSLSVLESYMRHCL